MDLGFGSSNQAVGTQLANAALQAATAQEAAIATEIAKYDSILNDATDTELEKLRERRLAGWKAAAAQRAQWLSNGHGVYTRDLVCGGGQGRQQSTDVANSFFDICAKSDQLVVHFHRASTRSCDVFHRALDTLAPTHPETRFVGINVEGCDDSRGSGSGVGAKFLVERLGIVVMPTLLLVKDRKVVHQVRGFDELGGREEFSASELAYVLGGHGALTRRDEEMNCSPGSGGSAVNKSGVGGGIGSLGGSMTAGGRGPTTSTLRIFGIGGSGGGGVRSGGYEDFDSDED